MKRNRPTDEDSMTAPATTLRTAVALTEAGLASPERVRDLVRVAERYGIAITPAMAALIDPGDADDPIARQFVPDQAELTNAPEETADPIGDEAHSPVTGIVHRYPDRVLLKLVFVCAVYCRFCFRRETVGPGKAHALSAAQIRAALDYVRAHPKIWEVILSGGDPLVLSPRHLRRVTEALAAIDHVKVLRVHTRVPAVDPARITPELVRALKAGGKATYIVLHANHSRELTTPARAACARLIDAGIPMLAQSVLLRGVNDDAETLGALMRAFVECRIKPYYLHHGDLAPGTAHLRTEIAEGQVLMRRLRGRFSGLCQPSYVLDIPGGYGKSPIGPGYLRAEHSETGPPRYVIEDYNGVQHAYPPVATAIPRSSSPAKARDAVNAVGTD
jgi:lysine 2,3-aminomutase